MQILSIANCEDIDLNSFSCGNEQLNTYLRKFAFENDKKGYGKTFVLEDNHKTLGYFTISTASIKFDSNARRI